MIVSRLPVLVLVLLLGAVSATSVRTLYSITSHYAGTAHNGTPYAVVVQESSKCASGMHSISNGRETTLVKCSTNYVDSVHNQFGSAPFIFQVHFDDAECTKFSFGVGVPVSNKCASNFALSDTHSSIGSFTENGSASIQWFSQPSCEEASWLRTDIADSKTVAMHSCDVNRCKWYSSKGTRKLQVTSGSGNSTSTTTTTSGSGSTTSTTSAAGSGSLTSSGSDNNTGSTHSATNSGTNSGSNGGSNSSSTKDSNSGSTSAPSANLTPRPRKTKAPTTSPSTTGSNSTTPTNTSGSSGSPTTSTTTTTTTTTTNPSTGSSASSSKARVANSGSSTSYDTASSSASSNGSSIQSAHGANIGVIIGIACGCLAVTFAFCALFFYCRSRKGKDSSQQETTTMQYTDMSTLHKTNMSQGQTGLWNDDVITAKRISRDEVQVHDIINRGGFGEVYAGVFHGRSVAVKMLLPATRDQIKHVNDFLAEARMTALMDHPRIVSLIGVAWHALSDLCVVFEFMDGGDLRTLLDTYERSDHPVGLDIQKATIAIHVCHALTYLHSLMPPIIHRDLKSRNVLLNSDLEAKLTDFGISRERPDATMTAGVGTSLWMAPEVMMGEKYDEKADIFSLGVVLSELDVHSVPYAREKQMMSDAVLLHQVALGKVHVAFSQFNPREFVELGLACTSVNPYERPSAAEALYRLQLILSTLENDQFVTSRGSYVF